jgi:flagellar M-ring protein FliF
VENAIVTISVADEDSFVVEEDRLPSTASVVLTLAGNTELDKNQIRGIELLVAKSVPGLDGKDVVIIDQNGAILNGADSDESASGAATKLDVVNTVCDQMKDKITSLLEPIFGKGGISVAVNAVMDFQKTNSEQTTYLPQNNGSGVVSKQETSTQNTGGGPSAGGVSGISSNTGVSTYAASGTGGSSSASQNSSTEFLVNQTLQSSQNDGGDIKDMTVAIMINSKELSAQDTEKYRQIVAAAAGVSEDKVAITNAEFTAVNALKAAAANAKSGKLSFTRLLVPIGIAGGMILLLLPFILVLRTRRRPGAAGEDDFPQLKTVLGESALQDAAQEEIPGEIVLNETREQGLKRQIKDFSSGNPDIVAQLIRTWIKEENNDNE